MRVAVAALAALMLAGTATAATIRGTARADLLVGTARVDVVLAGAGDDRISVEADARRDRVVCGPGRDLVALDRLDSAVGDCKATFAGPVAVGSTLGTHPRGLRMVPIPTADVDDSGRLLAVWPACVTRQICNGNDVVLSTSQDGATWSAPRRVSRSADALVPAIAAGPAGSLAVAYYARRAAGVDAWLVRSADGGVTWGRAQRLSPQTMALHTIADTNQGRMLADYVSVSWADGRPVAVLSLASPPSSGAFEQSIVAATAR